MTSPSRPAGERQIAGWTASELLKPHEIERTGDDSPVSSVYAFVMRMSGWRQAVVAAMAVALAGLAMAPLELQRVIIDDVLMERRVDLLMLVGGIYLAVLAVQQALKFCLQVYQVWLGESAIRYSREHLSELYRDNPDRFGSGSAVTVIGPEIDLLGGFVGHAFADPLVNGGKLLALFGYMVLVEPLIAGISVAFFLPQVVAVPMIQARINHYVDHRVGMLRRLGDRVGHTDFGSTDPRSWRHFRRRLDLIHFNRMRINVLKFASKAIVNLLNGLAPLSVLMVGGWLVIRGDTTIGIVVAFISGFDRMADPLRELIGFYRLAAMTQVRHARIAQWMRGGQEPFGSGTEAPGPVSQGTIEAPRR